MSQFDKWENRKRYHGGSKRPLPNTLGLQEGQHVWLRTSFGKVVLEQVNRITAQYAWCGSQIKIRLSNGLTEWKTYRWHGRAFLSQEQAESGEMPVTFKQFRLLAALGESPTVLYTKDVRWAYARIEELKDKAEPDWAAFENVLV